MVPAQSVETERDSASRMRASLAAKESLRSASRAAKCWRRRRSKAVRAALKRFHSACSRPRSMRGAAFHASRRAVKRSPVAFHWVDSARDSASTVMASRAASASSRWRVRAASRFSRAAAMSVSTSAHARSSSVTSPRKVGVARASRACARAVGAESMPRPSLRRWAARSTSTRMSSYLRPKNARPSSMVPAAQLPTATSPEGVRSHAVPSLSMRPKRDGSVRRTGGADAAAAGREGRFSAVGRGATGVGAAGTGIATAWTVVVSTIATPWSLVTMVVVVSIAWTTGAGERAGAASRASSTPKGIGGSSSIISAVTSSATTDSLPVPSGVLSLIDPPSLPATWSASPSR